VAGVPKVLPKPGGAVPKPVEGCDVCVPNRLGCVDPKGLTWAMLEPKGLVLGVELKAKELVVVVGVPKAGVAVVGLPNRLLPVLPNTFVVWPKPIDVLVFPKSGLFSVAPNRPVPVPVEVPAVEPNRDG